MNKIALFLLKYAPFKWFTLAYPKDNVLHEVIILLLIQFSIIALSIIFFIWCEFTQDPPVKLWRRIKTYTISLFVVILAEFLSYFVVLDVLIWSLHTLGLVLGTITAFGGFGFQDEKGGIITNSMFSYYGKIEKKEELLKRFENNYAELVKFKI